MPVRNGTTHALVLAAAFAAAGTGGSPVLAASVSERLDNIERKLDARGLVDMLNRIDQLQRDMQQLRGTLEQQGYDLEEIKRQQREQYMDIDRRLLQLETGQAGTAPGSVPVLMPGGETPPVATTPPVTAPPAMPPAGSPPAVAPVDPALAQTEYDTALAILREGRYADAALAFKQFLNNHPGSALADNAHYWLGETYYVTRDFDQALATFNALVTNYPQSPKVADSRLKIGYIHFEKQDWKKARAELESVVSTYPASTAARLANDRLARMKKEGH